MASLRKITLNAEAALLEKARAVARGRSTTLNVAFREWLLEFTAEDSNLRRFDVLMKELEPVNSGGRFSREERNQR